MGVSQEKEEKREEGGIDQSGCSLMEQGVLSRGQ